jgi:hypothetical protein
MAALALLCLINTLSALADDRTQVATPEISQTLTNAAYTSNGTFNYLLTLTSTTGAPAPAQPLCSAAFSLTKNDKKQLGDVLSFIEPDDSTTTLGPGTYRYKLECTTLGPIADYTIDKTVYKIEITVKANEPWYVYAVANDATAKSTAIEYNHRFDYTLPPYTPPPVTPTTPEQTPTPTEEPTETQGPTEAPTSTPTPGPPTPTPTPPDVPLDENGAPLGEWIWDDDEGVWILEEYPPLGDIAQTGDTMRLTLYITTASVSLLALLLLWATRRRKDGDTAR